MNSAVSIHPKALVESESIGTGTRIWAFAHVMAGAQIGANCNIGDHVFIESHVKLGSNVTVKNGVSIWDGVGIDDDVFVGPNAVFTNDLNPRAEIKKSSAELLCTFIRKGVTIGANATIVCGITIGTYAFVAAGAVVARDVPNFALIKGVPGKVSGWICVCATKLTMVADQAQCVACGRSYRKMGLGNIQLLNQ